MHSDVLPSRSFPPPSQPARPPRKNLLLAASIETGTLAGPVRIRNLSENGALIDGVALPEVGAALILRRLEIEIGATVVWRLAGRCGIRFLGNVSVDDWAIGKRRTAPLHERSQAGVDARQAAIRSGVLSLPGDDTVATAAPIETDRLDERIAEELADIRRILDTVGDGLSDDALILQQHAGALQQIDVACQILGELGAILGSKDRVAAMTAVNMHDLKVRLSRA